MSSSSTTTTLSHQTPQPTTPSSQPPQFTLLLFASAATYALSSSTTTTTTTTTTSHSPASVSSSSSSATPASSEIILSLPAPTTLLTLLRTLEGLYPGILAKVVRSASVVCNLEYVEGDIVGICDWIIKGGEEDDGGRELEGAGFVIESGDEVAVVPPVSAG